MNEANFPGSEENIVLWLPHRQPEVTLAPSPHFLQGPGSCHTRLPDFVLTKEACVQQLKRAHVPDLLDTDVW